MDEPRDLTYNWRTKYHQLFSDAVMNGLSGNKSLVQAAKLLVDLIPSAQPGGALLLGEELIPGPKISWRSESSPGVLSPLQVGQFGGSCTGTGILFVLAARSIGIPARLAGCSQSIPDDDHHWAEFWDGKELGPFGDSWHTREGSSSGNANGPWDSPSGPMLTCLQYLIPGDDINNMWSTSWLSPRFLPALWSPPNEMTTLWAFKGGINVCGSYCTTWGCGENNAFKWSQEECDQKFHKNS